jgi:uncharacterized glyoxalase superfamily protein PhnB
MQIRRAVPDLTADDPAAAAAFYTDVLGFEVAMDLGWVITCVAPGSPQVQVTLLRQDASAPTNPDLSVEVDDVDDAHAAAVRAGAEIVHPLTDEPWGVRRFIVRDHIGTVVNVVGHR